MAKDIPIVGAGLSGLVAATILARQGVGVRVFDTAARAGDHALHPSCHATPLDREFLWPHLGLDLDGCFRPVRRWEVYVGSERVPGGVRDFAVVERGTRATSVDSRLYALAREAGAEFEFSCDPDVLASLPDPAIVATGLNADSFRVLGIPCEVVSGYWARADAAAEHEDTGATWFGAFTQDYAYSCCTNGLRYFMALARGPREPDLHAWRTTLRATTGVTMDEWTRGLAHVPAWPSRPRLFARGKILAGTLCGLMDPLFLFGVTGALISGKIAAQAVTCPKEAEAELRRFARGHRRAAVLGAIWRRTRAWRLLRLPWLSGPLARLAGRTVPGYDENWISMPG